MTQRPFAALAAALLFAACSGSVPPKTLAIPEFAAGSEEDPEARRNWYWDQRTYPVGTIPLEVHRGALRRELNERRIRDDEPGWQSLGPAPLRDTTFGLASAQNSSGRTLAFAVHPADPNVLLVGTAMGGIWKSTDRGRSFRSTGPETAMPTLAVGVLKFHPANPNVLYAGTGEAHGSTSMYGSGLLRSTDGGETWQQLPIRGDGWNFDYNAITALQFDARDPNTMYVTTATIVASFFRTPANLPAPGLYKSTDGGNSWRLLRTAIRYSTTTTSAGFLDLEYGGPNAPDLLYMSEFLGGILRSRDGGETFQYVTPRKIATGTGFGTFPAPVTEVAYYDSKFRQYLRLRRFDNPGTVADFRRVEIGMSQKNPQVLYAGYESVTTRLDYNNNGVFDSADRTTPMSLLFKSEDGGDTWRWLGSVFDGIPDYCARQCAYDNVVTVNPDDENDVFLGGMANYNEYEPLPLTNATRVTALPWRGMVYRSLDGGKSWVDTTPHCAVVRNAPSRIEAGMPVYECERVDTTRVIHPDIHSVTFGPDQSIYVTTDGGLYRTVITQKPAPQGRQRAVAQRPYIPGAEISYRWENLNEGLSTLQFYRIATHPTDPNILLGGMQDNSCGYWNGTMWDGWGAGDGTIAEFDPTDPRIVYLGSQYAVHRHMQGGTKQFTPGAGWLYNVFDNSDLRQGEATSFVVVFAVDRLDPRNVYGASDKALYRSSNRGGFFTRASTTHETDGVPTSISVSTLNNNRVWISTSTGKIYRHEFNGTPDATITDVSAGLPNRYAAQVVAGFDSPDTVYAVFSGYDASTPATPGKVFVSTNAGATWTNITANLPDVPASAITLDPFDVNRIWVAQDLAVYSTRNRGGSWTSERRNMPVVGIMDIEYNANTGYLVAATHGRGVWRLPVSKNAVAALLESRD